MNTIPNARQFAVLGLGRFGSALARQLYALGKEVLAVDTDEQKVDDIAEYVTHAIAVDCLDEPAMRQIGLENFDVVIVGVGEMETSILATLICKEIGVKYVVAKAQSVQHRKVLERLAPTLWCFPKWRRAANWATCSRRQRWWNLQKSPRISRWWKWKCLRYGRTNRLPNLKSCRNTCSPC